MYTYKATADRHGEQDIHVNFHRLMSLASIEQW